MSEAHRCARRSGAFGLRAVLVPIVLGMSAAFPAVAQNTEASAVITVPPARELDLTIYRQGIAVVRDRRQVSIPAKAITLTWPGVAPSLQRDTIWLSGLARALRGYRIGFTPLSMESLLAAYVGRSVQVERMDSRGWRLIDAKLVSANPALVATEDGIRSVDPATLFFPELPPELGGTPALKLALAPAAGSSDSARTRQPVTVGYLAEGLSWTADYIATLGPAGDRLDLIARATLANASGMDIERARVELVAGRPNIPKVPEPDSRRVRMYAAEAAMAGAAAGPEPLGSLQRYNLDRPITLVDGERRSVRMFARHDIPLRRTYVASGGVRPLGRSGGDLGWHPVRLTTQLAWRAENGPLPAGTVRVYEQDAEGARRFLGGDRILDRPAGQLVRIGIGRPFDLTARRRQVGYERLSDGVFTLAHQIRVHNAGGRTASVRVEETIPGDWRITETNRRWQQAAAHLAVWRFEVPAGETVEITYQARIER